MTELAVVLPVITVMLVGVLTYGWVIAQDIAVADSARAGAEYALTRGNASNIQQNADSGQGCCWKHRKLPGDRRECL